MPLSVDAVALTQKLVSFDTVNPPGNEAACTAYLGSLLQDAGFRVDYYEMAPGRTSLVARAGAAGLRGLCFVGHTDTVPLGKAPWSFDPFSGRIVDGRLYGRGASDMKSGVAAFVAAAVAAKAGLAPHTGLTIVLAAGEETGCEGSSHLASLGVDIAGCTGVVVAEPTANQPLVGHKGALWLKAVAEGVSAHGSMPESGVNAIHKGLEMVRRLDGFCCRWRPHEVLGSPTLNVGTFQAGENVNSVPDRAEIGLDIRTVPGMDADALQAGLQDLLQPELAALAVKANMPAVWTAPDNAWMRTVFAITEAHTGQRAQVRAAPYFTDASALQPVLRAVPTVILGPGNPEVMHQTDEYCEVARIEQAVRIYTSMIEAETEAAGQQSALSPAGVQA